ncbi:acyltransferase family protein [Ruegeria conchae]|uniref:Peptidoglycan/LPS O-acetylase OafA/YrhL n=1 Tax=Ruegeria conchae TaxID=981384 RepID=A0A497Z839_9RHOB|nr:acyltransferase family protein [Ruegeria conchae]RLK03558.1 peptidoglycan/LPS O-acetylase OafA/YrhL [Ruegeria conchae]
MKYRPEIDGLRALAVIPVILFHAGFPYFTGGYVGVDVFFVISGYLITTILVSDLEQGRYSILKFYERRVRRIIPALFCVVVVSFVAGWFILLPADLKSFSLSVFAVTTFWSNFFFWMESGYFDTATELKPLLHTWSLAVEEQFYIFFPIALALLWRFGLKIVFVVLSLIFAVSFAFVTWDLGALSKPEAAFYLLPTRAWELMAGALAALYMGRPNPWRPSSALSGVLSVLGIALILYAIHFYDKHTPFPSPYALAPVLGTVLIILFERRGTWSFPILANPVCIGVGLISYSAYLWHQPVLAYARYLSWHEPPLWLMAVLCGLTLLLAFLSYKFVETPFRKGPIFPGMTIMLPAGTAGVMLIVAGLTITWTQGVPGRYAANHQAVFEQYDDPANYVRGQFSEFQNAEFDGTDQRKKLLIIGDSYAQDMLNAVLESPLADKFQLSTFYISGRCGNLFLKRDFTDLIAPKDRELCAKRPGYEDETLQARIEHADEIWLVSSWKDWQVENLPESLENLGDVTLARIRVMGRKNFGSGMSLKRYMTEFETGNENIMVEMSQGHLATNQSMNETLSPAQFVDISNLMCGNGKTCRNTNEDGLLISYDGGHLTRAGAIMLGHRLTEWLE